MPVAGHIAAVPDMGRCGLICNTSGKEELEMTREVMFVGSVPLKPAEAVFEHMCSHGLAPLLPRVPDGEQAGWVGPMVTLPKNPAFEPWGEPVPITNRATTFFDKLQTQTVRLKPGLTHRDVHVEDLGIARAAESSYAAFRQAKSEGKLAANTRFTVTVIGPGTGFFDILLAPDDLFPLVERVYLAEIERILKVVPHEELAIQIDVASELEMDEYRRRPQDYDLPGVKLREPYWPKDRAIAAVATIANSIPAPVELGFHLCALYHVDESQGQDIGVHIEWANALKKAITRHIDFMHIPTTPTFDERDFAQLTQLQLDPSTELYLGLVHVDDGVEGARRRIAAAEKYRKNFGIAAYCGLAGMSRKQYTNPLSIGEVLDIHRDAAS